MIVLIAAALGSPVSPGNEPRRIYSDGFKEATRTYSDCLSESAGGIARTVSSRTERYRLYVEQCADERADMIATFVADNSPYETAIGSQDRRSSFLWAAKHAAEIAMSKARFLDPGPQDGGVPQPVVIIDAQD